MTILATLTNIVWEKDVLRSEDILSVIEKLAEQGLENIALDFICADGQVFENSPHIIAGAMIIPIFPFSQSEKVEVHIRPGTFKRLSQKLPIR